MAERATSTLRRKELGRRLRDLRTARGHSLEVVAAELLCSVTKVSRMESGARAVGARDVRDLCRFYGVEDADRDALMELLRESHQTSWWQRFDLQYGTYIGLEQSASSISEYNSFVVPGLLQTKEYATAFIAGAVRVGPDEVKRRVDARMTRQAVLTEPDPPRFSAIVDELALVRTVGDDGVMARQLEHLDQMSQLRNVFLQIIPLESHLYEGYGQPFIVLRFANSEIPPVVYVENDFGDLYLERKDDVERSDALFDQHRAAGLGYAQTRTRLAALRNRLFPETETRSESP